MSDPKLGPIMAMLRELSSKVDALQERIDQKPDDAPRTEDRIFSEVERLNQNLEVLGSAIGTVHFRVSHDDPLPDTILEHSVMSRFVESYPEHYPQPFNPPGREAQIRHFANMTMAELLAFQTEVREVLESPGETNRRRFNARHYDQPLSEEISNRQREKERGQQRDRGRGR